MTGKLLRQYVIDELDFDPSFDSANVGVAVENGVVTLTGHVGSYAEKIAAEKAAQRVKGVHAVAQEIEVRYPEQKKTADDQIAERAVAIIGWDAMVPVDAVMVKVQKGWVTLTGNVEWQYQRTAAESAIRRLSGVIGVTESDRGEAAHSAAEYQGQDHGGAEAQRGTRGGLDPRDREGRQGDSRG